MKRTFIQNGKVKGISNFEIIGNKIVKFVFIFGLLFFAVIAIRLASEMINFNPVFEFFKFNWHLVAILVLFAVYMSIKTRDKHQSNRHYSNDDLNEELKRRRK